MFISLIATYEDEDKIYDFLSRNTTQQDIRTRTLLEDRFNTLGQNDLYRPMMVYNAVRNIISALRIDLSPKYDPAQGIGYNRACLEFLNTIVGIDEKTRREHPVLADGVPDLWLDLRLIKGLHLSCRLAMIGETDEALDILEESVEVWIRFFTLPVGSELSFRYAPENALNAKLMELDHGWRHAVFTKRIGFMPEGKEEFHAFRSWELPRAIMHSSVDWFDPIREHPRYLACVERVQKVMDELGIIPW